MLRKMLQQYYKLIVDDVYHLIYFHFDRYWFDIVIASDSIVRPLIWDKTEYSSKAYIIILPM